MFIEFRIIYHFFLTQPTRWDNLYVRDINVVFTYLRKIMTITLKTAKSRIQVQWLNQGYAKEHKPRYSTPVRDDILTFKSAFGKCYLDGPS